MSTAPHQAVAGVDPAWEQRVTALWAALPDSSVESFLAAMQALVAERAADDPVALFEHASALDSTGHPDAAVPLYRQSLAQGLGGLRRRRATIQMASSLRNLGCTAESVALLTAELEASSDELDDAVRAFLALALADSGREREGLAIALGALARHLPRYQRSLTNYAAALSGGEDR